MRKHKTITIILMIGILVLTVVAGVVSALRVNKIKTLAAGGTVPGARPRAVQEILNYFEVLRFIGTKSGIFTIKVPQILKLHSIIGCKNALDRGPVGAFRDYKVFVGNHTPPPPASVPYLTEALCQWLN